MSDYVYPRVPKKMWPAVSFACHILQERKTFNRAIEIASGYYKVDPDELKKHVVARCNAGKKEKAYRKRIFKEYQA